MTPYDEFPYRSYPVEWTAPERLALASLVHGGPRAPLQAYDMLELGCGDGANLLALASYRPHGRFVGLDGAASRITAGQRRVRALGLQNLELLACDLQHAAAALEGRYDYIVAHGVFSWIPDDARDALLALCADRLRAGGLLYLNYNAHPGWMVRGMVREHLRSIAGTGGSLAERAYATQAAARQVVSALDPGTHPYGPLIANEYAFVVESDPTYVAHEYLSEHNVAYWRSEFESLVRRYGFEFVAAADFDRPSGRTEPALPQRLDAAGIGGPHPADVLDLLC
jgi:SAM-dependent methyltransferase